MTYWRWLWVLALVATAWGDEGLTERGMRPALLSPVTCTPSGHRFAVVVGVGAYQDPAIPRLRYAPGDAQALCQYLLTEGGFAQDSVWQLVDAYATRSQLERVLADDLPKRVQPQDLVVVYFAGHGFATANGELVLLLNDTHPDRLVSTGLTASRLGEMLSYLTGARVAVVLDTCFSGAAGSRAFTPPNQTAGAASAVGERLRAEGRFILSASRADEPAYEADSLGHGLLTWSLLEALRVGDRNLDGQLTWAELYDHVFERVKAASVDRQHPDQTSTGNLVLWSGHGPGQGAAGRVTVRTNPLGARIFLDGLPARQGQGGDSLVSPTPPLPLAEGAHRVSAYLAGFDVAQQLVQVRAGQTQAVQIELHREQPPASLLVTGLQPEWAGASVIIGDHPVGTTTGAEAFFPGLVPGPAVPVRVERLGFQPFTATVALVGGELRTLAVRLVPLPEGGGAVRPPGMLEADGRFRWERDQAEMVWVAGGQARLGTNERWAFLAQPEHTAAAAGFWLDRYEVTVAQFRRFVQASGYQAVGPWQDEAGEGRDDYPVTSVTRADAEAYAAWAGKSLPTETEWEYAARGAEGRLYPYGNTFQEQQANVPRTRLRRTTPVGCFSRAGGDAPCGAADLSGNVAEWTTSNLSPYPGHPNPGDGRFSTRLAVVRGGSFRSADSRLDSTAIVRIGVDPERYSADIGFRCVLRVVR